MRVSIVTATFNSADVLPDCLRSVADQSFPDKEHIVIDGLSSDATMALLETEPNCVSRSISEPDKGLYDALNKGVRLAQGDVIGFLHSDDFYPSTDILNKVCKTFAITRADGVYGDLCYVSRSNTGRVLRYWKSRPFSPALLRRGWMPPHPTLFLRKSVYERFGDFDTGFGVAADYEFILRIMSQPDLKFVYLPELLVKMRSGGTSNRSLGNILRKSREDYLAIRRNGAGGAGTLLLKNLSKLPQFFSHPDKN